MEDIVNAVVDRRPNPGSGGRPSREESARRTETMIEVATALFLERGYEATSMEQVAVRAHVGKRTLYARFPDKRSLFAAAIGRLLNRWYDPKVVPRIGSLEERLTAVSLTYLEISTSTEGIALHRLLVTEMRRYPELGELLQRDFEQRGPSLLENTLQGCLEDGLVTREGDRADTGWALKMSRMLGGALLTEPRRRIIFVGQPMGKAEREAWAADVVKLFVKGII